jgi:uncharacterized cupredoxin-like copper-binding protein
MSTGARTAGATRTVNVQMSDLAFTPGNIEVRAGETVKFVFTNKGLVDHDAFIGDTAAQSTHGMNMGATGTAGHDMANDGGITVKPGKAGEVTMTFNKSGGLEIGCHEPGHYEAGMKAMVTVT